MPLDEKRLDALGAQLVGKLVSVATRCNCGACLPPDPLDGTIGVVERLWWEEFNEGRGITASLKQSGWSIDALIHSPTRDIFVFIYPNRERLVIE